MTTKKITKKQAPPSAFSKIAAGLAEAISIAKGEADPKTYKVHVPDAVDVRAVRKAAKLSQVAFADAYGFTPAAIRDWEQGRRIPDRSTRAYLKVIEKKPQIVQEVLNA
jgi:putative transcriptional regulator